MGICVRTIRAGDSLYALCGGCLHLLCLHGAGCLACEWQVLIDELRQMTASR